MNNSSQKELPPMLNEFRTALEAEIKAVSTNSYNNAIPMSNGRKLNSLADEYQYQFKVENNINTPDGAPCTLIISDKQQLDAIIVSYEGSSIIVSVKSDLGEFVPHAKLISDFSMLLKKLIERIEANSHLPNPAGNRILNLEPVKKIRNVNFGSLISNDLKPGQKEAVRSVFENNTTVIWGPPGTGKTRTIGAIVKAQHAVGKSVLLVSHTNVAVDQAIYQIADNFIRSNHNLKDGAILRLGEAKNKDLTVGEFRNVTIQEQRKIKSESLSIRKDDLENQRVSLKKDIELYNRQIALKIWYEKFETDYNDYISQHKSLNDQIRNLERLNSDYDIKTKRMSLLESDVNYISQRNDHDKKRQDLQTSFNELASQELSLNNDLAELQVKIDDQKIQIQKALALKNLRMKSANLPSLTSQTVLVNNLKGNIEFTNNKLIDLNNKLVHENNVYQEVLNSSFFARTVKRLPKPDVQEAIITKIKNDISNQEKVNISNEKEIVKIESRINEIEKLQREIGMYQGVGTYEEENNKGDFLEKLYNKKLLLFQDIRSKKQKLENSFNLSTKEYNDRFNRKIENPQKIINEYNTLKNDIRTLTISIPSLRSTISQQTEELNSNITEHFNTLKKYISQLDDKGNIVEKLNELNRVKSRVGNETRFIKVDESNAIIKQLNDAIKDIKIELREIDEKLNEIEKVIINDAKIIGTTLTKAYLSDLLFQRKFDTVILDEASMAPIPAIWIVSILSSENVVIVGDFKQLPPIVISKSELALKWLGRDIFAASGLIEKYNTDNLPDHFKALFTQMRMEKEIAEIANIYYDGRLNSEKQPDKNFYDWYEDQGVFNKSVSLVDTGSLNAWVTSVVKNGNSSRLNFLSAVLSVDIGRSLISKYIDMSDDGNKDKKTKVLIISPYRAHSKLVDKLITTSENLEGYIQAGTVHSFQGSEADIVIFDLVVDEPHYKVNQFMHTPEIIEQMQRLYTVSVTRAQNRLIIIGNFDYCIKKGKKSELGGEGGLINYLDSHFERIDAKLLSFQLGYKSVDAQNHVFGGPLKAKYDGLVVLQDQFYNYLVDDFELANEKVIIYSPFMTQNRINYLKPHIMKLLERDKLVYFITKSRNERSKKELDVYTSVENQLKDLGVKVIYKKGMHEKLVFIDDNILWSGSLNTLSFNDSQEIMERRQNEDTVRYFKNILKVDELTEIVDKPESICPICGSSMIAAEGADDPFYWRCENENCYTRGIDQPYPHDGLIRCKKCGSDLEFAYRGEAPSWKCKKNSRHYQMMYSNQLKMAKMRELIPNAEIENIEKFFMKIADEKAQKRSTKASKTAINKSINAKSTKMKRKSNVQLTINLENSNN